MGSKVRRPMLILCVLFFSVGTFAQGLMINEIMSNNKETLMDNEGGFSDWIELYNPTSEVIDLGSYHLSDDKRELSKWQLPKMDLLKGEYILIYASGKDKRTERHTNFKISSGGEPLYLTNDEGRIVDKVLPKVLGPDEAYGRIEDGKGDWWNLEVPSPGASNNLANQIIFSHKPGFYKRGFSLKAKSFHNYELRYTLNGSAPTDSSLLFDSTLEVSNRSFLPNKWSTIRTTEHQSWQSTSMLVPKATVLRCAGFKNKEQMTSVYTQTYFVGGHVFDFDLPVLSLVTDSLNLFDHDTGIYVAGAHLDTTNPQWTGNFYQKGRMWERDAHIAYFDKEGDLGFSQDAGIRIHGLRTRFYAQKSLKVYAREEYGKKHFNYPLFPQKEHKSYKRFLLRGTMGSWSGETVFQDELAHDIIRNLDLEYQDFQPVIVFINGEYWGIQTIRDKIDERYLAYTAGADEDSVDLIGGNYRLVSAGTNEHYVALLNYLGSHDLSVSDHYKYVKTQIDIDNYIDYQIAELFFANVDWPSNNMKLWRPQTKDGKWRWIFHDIDAGFANNSRKMLQHATLNDTTVSYPNSPESTLLLRALLQSDEFKNQLIHRYNELLNSTFKHDITVVRYRNLKDKYESDMTLHSRRWNYPESLESWNEDLEENIVMFLVERPCYVSGNVMAFFDLESFGFECAHHGLRQKGIGIVPNPCFQYFEIENKSREDFEGQLQVLDMYGRQVLRQDSVFVGALQRHSINVSHLQGGTYLLVMRSNGLLITEKIAIVR